MAQDERLQKFLRDCGLGSRRQVEEFIKDGKVTVNGQTAQLGMKVDPSCDSVKYKGRRLSAGTKVHYLLHKPVGYICTTSQQDPRPKATDLIRPPVKGLFTVGRLDINTSGLVIVTNDGEFNQALIHPSCGHTKQYTVVSRTNLPPVDARRLEKGIRIDDGPPARARVLSARPRGSRFEVILEVSEGRHHLVRDLMKAVNVPVERLIRTRVGPFELGHLEPGYYAPIPLDMVEQVVDLYKSQRR